MRWLKQLIHRGHGDERAVSRGGTDRTEETTALAQRLTRLGSGPYSGAHFLATPDTSADDKWIRVADESSEAARHDHRIIDDSRHVSSIGRR